jgi:hypothetical protein
MCGPLSMTLSKNKGTLVGIIYFSFLQGLVIIAMYIGFLDMPYLWSTSSQQCVFPSLEMKVRGVTSYYFFIKLNSNFRIIAV